MPVLMSHAGNRLYATAEGLAHAQPAEAVANLTIRRDGQTLRLEATEIGSWTFTWQRDPGRNVFCLNGSDGFLTIDEHGKTRFAKTADGENARFLLLSDSQYADLVYVTQHRWAMELPLAKSRPPEMAALSDGFVLRLCGCNIPLGRADIAFPRIWHLSAQSPGETIFQYGDFLVGRARLYKPLIYCSAFGDDRNFAMLALFLESLETLGAYDGQILILADREPLEIAPMIPAVFLPRTNVLKVSYTSAMESATARYRVSGQAFAEYQPMLYLNTDIIAASPVEPLLADLVQQDGICFACEYYDKRHTEVQSDERMNRYGRPIFAADPDWSGRIECLNTGLIGFTRTAEADRIFPLILAVMALYDPLDPNDPISAEQRAASYVVQKLAASQPDFLNRYAQILNHNQPDIAVRHLTLVRFNHSVDSARKLDMMRKYYDALRERDVEPAMPAGPDTAFGGL